MQSIYQKCKLATSLTIVMLASVSCGGDGGGGDVGNKGAGNRVPIAAAGSDLNISRNFIINLDGSDSRDDDGDSLTYTWIQTAGTDVTEGVGSLLGESPVFQAPVEVGTLMFDLVVYDGTADSEPDTVVINVLEDVNTSFFVDGDAGDDETGNGSKENPYASIAKALCDISQDQQDIYVMTRLDQAVYEETTDPCPGEESPRNVDQILMIPTGSSLYGGYDQSWVRNVGANATPVNTLHYGFIFSNVDINAWFSGFKVQTKDSPSAKESVYALNAVGGMANLYINDNELTAGNVGFGAAKRPGNSYGLLVALMAGASIERNVISAGFGGDGLDLDITFTGPAVQGGDGSPGSKTRGGSAGSGRGLTTNDGGNGGNAGTQGGGNGSNGTDGQGASGQGGCGGGRSRGAYDCIGEDRKGDIGRVGQNGARGSVGTSGKSGGGEGQLVAFIDGGAFAYFRLGNGGNGINGSSGSGAGGGGGGEASAGVNGGGGGGGGGGGQGGRGGRGGTGGGASIGLFIAATPNVLVNKNRIFSSQGGYGASGGLGQIGGDGGSGGSGSSGNSSIFGTGGKGGNGGNGGKGGSGGRGAAGGGGPSYGLAIGGDIAPTVTDNEIASGDGQQGGFGGNKGNGGDGGNSFAVFDNNIDDGIVPVLSNNNLNYGSPGDGGGTSNTKTGKLGSAGQSGTTNW